MRCVPAELPGAAHVAVAPIQVVVLLNSGPLQTTQR